MKTKLIAALAAALMMAGCAMTQEQIAAMNAADDERCKEYGAQKGSPQYTQCRMLISEQRRQENAARRAAIADGFDAASRSFQQNRRLNCTTTGFGNMTQTSCY